MDPTEVMNPAGVVNNSCRVRNSSLYPQYFGAGDCVLLVLFLIHRPLFLPFAFTSFVGLNSLSVAFCLPLSFWPILFPFIDTPSTVNVATFPSFACVLVVL